VIGCEDRLRSDLYCVEWGVKLYSNSNASCWPMFKFFRQKIAATNFDHYWHRRHSIRIRVYETIRYLSIFSSVRLSVRSPAAAACGGFAAVGPAGSRYRSIAARSAPQQHGAAARRTAANAGSATFSAYEVN